MPLRRVIILGSTGSIGTQALDVIEHLNREHDAGRSADRFVVVGLCAGRNQSLLLEQAARFGVREIALRQPSSPVSIDARVRTGSDAPERLVREVEADLVVAAMVGSAGLPATLAAVELGRDVALANKETLVAAGELVVTAAHRSGSKLLPVDSEHAAVWQCLAAAPSSLVPPLRIGTNVRDVYLTASGGPFRTWTAEQIASATPGQALCHPTWKMGPKVTIDSATLMNKALELIEAHWLFGIPAAQLHAIVHPQSLVHAIVEFADGSSVAQIGAPDMKCPIQLALCWPARPNNSCRRLVWSELRTLQFEPPDTARFPAIMLAYEAMKQGGGAGAVLNASNEVAVEAFLAGRFSFGRIATLVSDTMNAVVCPKISSLDDVREAERRAREHASALVAAI